MDIEIMYDKKLKVWCFVPNHFGDRLVTKSKYDQTVVGVISKNDNKVTQLTEAEKICYYEDGYDIEGYKETISDEEDGSANIENPSCEQPCEQSNQQIPLEKILKLSSEELHD